MNVQIKYLLLKMGRLVRKGKLYKHECSNKIPLVKNGNYGKWDTIMKFLSWLSYVKGERSVFDTVMKFWVDFHMWKGKEICVCVKELGKI